MSDCLLPSLLFLFLRRRDVIAFSPDKEGLAAHLISGAAAAAEEEEEI